MRKGGENVPFKAYMIHNRNPESVKLRGMTNMRSSKADALSSSSSTIPIA
jgi:hypothetical protein